MKNFAQLVKNLIPVHDVLHVIHYEVVILHIQEMTAYQDVYVRRV